VAVLALKHGLEGPEGPLLQIGFTSNGSAAGSRPGRAWHPFEIDATLQPSQVLAAVRLGWPLHAELAADVTAC